MRKLQSPTLPLVPPQLLLPTFPRTELPLLQPVQPRLLLLDHEVVLRASFFRIRLAAGVRLQLELFSV